MEELKTKKKPLWHDIEITGRWRLKYNVTNNIGPEAFGGKMLIPYKSPFDSTKVYLRNVDFEVVKGFMIDKIIMDFYPDKDPNHKLIISWLICNPEIDVKGVKKLDDRILSKKEGSGKIVLLCRDYLEEQDIDDEDYIDKLIGRLSADKGVYALGLNKIKYIMAELGMTYNNPRFTGETEKKALRSKLKSFVRKSLKNAKTVNAVIDNLDNAKENYEFKEMVRLRILTFSNGLYKWNNTPLGENFERVQVFLNNHPEVKATLLALLYKDQK